MLSDKKVVVVNKVRRDDIVKMRIREAINRVLWTAENLDEYFLVVVDRLSSTGYAYLSFKYLERVDNNYVYIRKSRDSGAEELSAIPLHRIVRIEKSDGTVIWSRNATR